MPKPSKDDLSEAKRIAARMLAMPPDPKKSKAPAKDESKPAPKAEKPARKRS